MTKKKKKTKRGVPAAKAVAAIKKEIEKLEDKRANIYALLVDAGIDDELAAKAQELHTDAVFDVLTAIEKNIPMLFDRLWDKAEHVEKALDRMLEQIGDLYETT